jgi:hypothetical protein
MTWYEGENVNKDIPATWMAAHYDFTEQGDAGWAYANAYIAAGGKYAIDYSDPEIIPFCNSPFATANGAHPGSCSGPVGNTLNATESAWLHDAAGNRLHVTAYGTQAQGQWQDRANPNSTAVQAAYRTWETSVVTNTRWNALEVDDVQSSYVPSYFQYKFGATSKEFDALGANANATWLSAQEHIAAAAPRPVFLNGITSVSQTALLTAPNVIGHMVESCATTVTNTPIMGAGWIANMNTLLQGTALQRYVVCINYYPAASNGVAERMYGLASWWLTYDPNYSVLFDDIPTADGHQTYPEHGITVFSPFTTASGQNITTLRSSTGVYVREFAYCYVQKVAIGPCATEVNSDSVAHALPTTLHYKYAHYLVLSTKSWYAGGTVAWAAGTFTSLGAASARIVKL